MKNVYTCILILVMGVGLLMMGCGPPPTYPINATDGEGSSVTVTWDEWAHGTSAATFDIWRSDAPEGSYTEIATGKTSPFADTPDPDKVFFYKVEAADTAMSGYDAGFRGSTLNNTALDWETETPKWSEALTNLDTQFQTEFPAPLAPGTYVLNCDGGGTETVTITKPDDLTVLDIVLADCKDNASGETLNGFEELVINGSFQGYLRLLLDFDDGSWYANADIADDPGHAFVTSGSWGGDTELIEVP